RELAARIAARDAYPIVEACFLELAEPDLPTGGDRCVARGAKKVLMIPYFLSAGVHQRPDLASPRHHLPRRHPPLELRLGPPLGPDPLLDKLVAERIRALDSTGT